jgi:Zn-finger nucleic acid-binding protein
MADRNCPDCREKMVIGRLGPLELDLCIACGGVWFDCGELGRVIAAGPAIVRRLSEKVPARQAGYGVRSVGPPTCPACRVPLGNVEYASMPGVHLDACTFCEGFWANRPTLIRLAASLEGASVWDQMAQERKAMEAPAPPQAPPNPAPAQPPAGRPTRPGAPAAKAPAPAASQGELCPNCGEKNGDRAAVCWACGHALQGPVVCACPRCEASMRRVVSENVTLSACEGCGGTSLTPNRLNAILLQPVEAQDRLFKQVKRYSPAKIRNLRSELLCPHCNLTMFSGPLGMITQKLVPACPQCYTLFVSIEVLDDILHGQRR